MTAITASPIGGQSVVQQLRWWISDAWAITVRNLRRIPRQPDMLFFMTLQPVMFILLFRYVFGGAIGMSVPNGDYAQFLMPGIFVQTVLFGSVGATGVGIADDMKRGVMDRFRSLPMSRTSVLLGRTLADVVMNAVTVVVMVAVGLAVGFRFEGGLALGMAGVGLMLLFGFAFSWIAALIGLSVSSVEAAQSAGFMWLFPLTFASSAFTPVKTITPDWLRVFAEHNPVSANVDACRALFNGTDLGNSLWLALFWSAVVIAVFAPLAVLKFRRASSR